MSISALNVPAASAVRITGKAADGESKAVATTRGCVACTTLENVGRCVGSVAIQPRSNRSTNGGSVAECWSNADLICPRSTVANFVRGAPSPRPTTPVVGALVVFAPATSCCKNCISEQIESNGKSPNEKTSNVRIPNE